MNAQRWAVGEPQYTQCRDQTDKNWVVKYDLTNTAWQNVDERRIRYAAKSWRVSYGKDRAQVESYTPGVEITLCLGGLFLSAQDIKNTWVWLKP